MKDLKMQTNEAKAIKLLESIQSGDPAPFAYLHPERYRQHNLSLADGAQGIASVLRSQPLGTFKARVVRSFQDGDFVVTHTEYDFFGPKAGFDVFRFEDGIIVEHWDNLMNLRPLNKSGHSLLDGESQLRDLDKTQGNKQLVETFFRENILGRAQTFSKYISANMVQHNPDGADGLIGLAAMMQDFTQQGRTMRYDQIHKVLGSGNFVLLMCEGSFGEGNGQPTAFYDLFRVENEMIVEHWDILETIPPRSLWQNNNGKF